MISEKLVAFLHGPVLSFVGTRDARLRPSVSWVFGARVSAPRNEITIFIPDVEAEPIKGDAQKNGQIAYTVVDPMTHEAYQFKGMLVDLRPSVDEERAVQEIYRSKVVSYMSKYPKEIPEGYRLSPSTALTFRVDQAFIQTPGPDAGKQIDLSAFAC